MRVPVNSGLIPPASVSRARAEAAVSRPPPHSTHATGTDQIRLSASDLSDDRRPLGSPEGPASLRRRIRLDAKEQLFWLAFAARPAPASRPLWIMAEIGGIQFCCQ